MADLYRTLSEDAATNRIADSRCVGEAMPNEELKDPWAA
jgi:hypothetical protein